MCVCVWVSEWVSEWQGHILSCPGQIKQLYWLILCLPATCLADMIFQSLFSNWMDVVLFIFCPLVFISGCTVNWETCIDRVPSKDWLLIQSWACVTASINFSQFHLIKLHTSPTTQGGMRRRKVMQVSTWEIAIGQIVYSEFFGSHWSFYLALFGPWLSVAVIPNAKLSETSCLVFQEFCKLASIVPTTGIVIGMRVLIYIA